jgi:hypothetical protein
LPEQDWKRIKAELNAARPGTSETPGCVAANKAPEIPAHPDEEGVLRHIANALRLDMIQ